MTSQSLVCFSLNARTLLSETCDYLDVEKALAKWQKAPFAKPPCAILI